ncbi:hypothetical protein [Ottowia sp. VDI28]|uniref:hypothetical protein n=1 Tax=Ottowia sp. VDI28 TaxID=3133968 RepID=UPI003C2B7E04
MNSLREALAEYLELRRGLGFKLQDAGRQLPHFVAYLEQQGWRAAPRRASRRRPSRSMTSLRPSR